MSYDEFEFNKDLLKEIASKRKELKDTISMANNEQSQKEIAGANRPAYEIFNL
jgi:hypothetical protein